MPRIRTFKFKNLKKSNLLANNLHLIDFEQLRIENVSIYEKIEERNDDLNKLKKITKSVQTLTHIREKLYFLKNENDKLSFY